MFPGGSKERVNRAGRAVREGSFSGDDLIVIDTWRAAHREVINTFQSILRTRARGKGIFVAQRHKRGWTIFDKLRRLPKMELSRMDDVAGCRLIFSNAQELQDFRNVIHGARRIKHRLKNEPDRYNYILSPKSTGYRGIHDVYVYNVNSANSQKLNGLLIEIQYRTKFQHAWATAVELIGLVTSSQPKFQEGDQRYEYAMGLASEIIARVYEDAFSCYPDMPNEEVVSRFIDVERELNLLGMLKALNATDGQVTEYKNFILIFDKGKLEVIAFKEATEALQRLFEIEKDSPDLDVVLVKGDDSEVREAFRNYFSDAREFVRLIEEGCHQLAELSNHNVKRLNDITAFIAGGRSTVT